MEKHAPTRRGATRYGARPPPSRAVARAPRPPGVPPAQTLHPPGTRQLSVDARCIGKGGRRQDRGRAVSRAATGRRPTRRAATRRGPSSSRSRRAPPRAADDGVACGESVRRHRVGRATATGAEGRASAGAPAGVPAPLWSGPPPARPPAKYRAIDPLTSPLLYGACGASLFPQRHTDASAHHSPRVSSWRGHGGLPAIRPSPAAAHGRQRRPPPSHGAHADRRHRRAFLG